MLLGDVVDELHDDDGLADACAAEEPDLSAFQERLNQVDDLHAGLKHFGSGRLFVERRSQAMNRHALVAGDRAKIVDRFADHVHHAAQRAAANRSGDGAALIDGLHAAHHAFGGFHGDATHAAFAEMLLHFENDVDWRGNGEAVADHAKGLDKWEASRLRRTARRRRVRRFELRVQYFLT